MREESGARPPEGIEHFEMPFDVRPEDIDVLDHVNNIVYLRWVQEIAVAHWNSATTAEERAEVVWVVVRHEIDYRQSARRGDRLLARTWVGPTARHAFERNTVILRAADGAVLARARTLWVPIDPGTGRVAQVSAGIRERFSVAPPPA